MLPFLNVLQYLVLTLWVGSMFGFGALYAPVLFRNLAAREEAGAIAGETLGRIHSVGLVTSGIMLVVTALQAIESGWSSLDLGRFLCTGVMTGVLLLSAVTIRQRMDAIKRQMGKPLDEIPPDAPLRMEYRRYHRISSGLFSLEILLGVVLIILTALR